MFFFNFKDLKFLKTIEKKKLFFFCLFNKVLIKILFWNLDTTVSIIMLKIINKSFYDFF